jgi:tetratricopeptide (TPR) repeat protein
MYSIVMKWDWGNSGNSAIYHDPETRKNSITYRTNLARLMETLLLEGKNDKAEKVIDLAMAKMPIAYFEYYSMVEPFAMGYYEVGKKDKARKVVAELIQKYQESLTYFSGFKLADQYYYASDIVSDIEQYRGLIELIRAADDREFYEKEKAKFNNFNKRFAVFNRKME